MFKPRTFREALKKLSRKLQGLVAEPWTAIRITIFSSVTRISSLAAKISFCFFEKTKSALISGRKRARYHLTLPEKRTQLTFP